MPQNPGKGYKTKLMPIVCTGSLKDRVITFNVTLDARMRDIDKNDVGIGMFAKPPNLMKRLFSRCSHVDLQSARYELTFGVDQHMRHNPQVHT